MATRATTDIKKRHYRFMYRVVATGDTPPADLAAWTTLLATFTEGGYIRNKSLVHAVVEGDVEELDDNDELRMGLNGSVEAILLQTGDADYTEMDGIDNTVKDVLLYAEAEERSIFYPSVVVKIDEELTGGETETMKVMFKKNNFSAKADFRTRWDTPTV